LRHSLYKSNLKFKKMKKVLFVFFVAALAIATSCRNKAAETAAPAEAPVEAAPVEAAPVEAAPADSAAVAPAAH
jgi:hypothetical protein